MARPGRYFWLLAGILVPFLLALYLLFARAPDVVPVIYTLL